VRAGRRAAIAVVAALVSLSGAAVGADAPSPLPKGFVHLREVAPDIQQGMRYFTAYNFVGTRIDGYLAPTCILTVQAAEALKAVQAELAPLGLGLKVYDCYRPQRAVDHFIRWARDLADTKMKSAFYPDVDKKDLFKDGYIAARSSHTRGSTTDLTIVTTDGDGKGRDIDMGTGFDLFSPKSWPTSLVMTGDQRAHRLLLQALMVKHGFAPYPQEWWHFTLKGEPFPDTYFDFPVQ
jgi:zinc D-Ala-D-Ala dipeptidase